METTKQIISPWSGSTDEKIYEQVTSQDVTMSLAKLRA